MASADPNIREAATAGRDVLVRFAVAINLPFRSVPSAALRWAAEHGHNELIKPLLENGANVNSTDGVSGPTGLHAAARKGHADCLTTLIEHGANVNAVAGNLTPLHSATFCGHIECVTALLRHGADVNSRVCGGDTPLHLAAVSGFLECFGKLTEYGADITLRNDSYKTALDMADESTKQQMQNIVETFGLQTSSNRINDAETKAGHRKSNESLFMVLPPDDEDSSTEVELAKEAVNEVIQTLIDTAQRVDDVTNRTSRLDDTEKKIKDVSSKIDQQTAALGKVKS